MMGITWLWLLSCSPQPEPEPIWLSTDPHVHSSLGSNDTDGLGLPGVIAAQMESLDLDLIWLTDHSNSLGSMHCEDVEDCPNLGPEQTPGAWPSSVHLGVELSPRHPESDQPVGHVGCLPESGAGFSATFIDRPLGALTGREAVEQCADQSGFSIVNHPFGPAQWVAFDWSTEDFDALEVYNGGGGFDSSDASAVARWEEGVAAGRSWIPIGASDSHRWDTAPPGTLLDPALGWPRTWVGVSDSQTPYEALRAGRVILGDPSTELRCWAERGSDRAWPGGRIDGPATLVVEASTAESGLILEVIELDTGTTQRLHSAPLNGPERLTLELEGMTVYARVWNQDPAFGVRGVSMCNRIVIE